MLWPLSYNRVQHDTRIRGIPSLNFKDHAFNPQLLTFAATYLPLRSQIGNRSAPRKHNRTNTDFKGADVLGRAHADNNLKIRTHCMHAVLNYKSKLAYPLNLSSQKNHSATHPYCNAPRHAITPRLSAGDLPPRLACDQCSINESFGLVRRVEERRGGDLQSHPHVNITFNLTKPNLAPAEMPQQGHIYSKPPPFLSSSSLNMR